VKLTIELSDKQHKKLEALAASRTKMSGGKTQYTPALCIQGFIDACVTDGGGWMTPNQAAVKYEADKKAKQAKKKPVKKTPPGSRDDGRVW
jgi:hypothetical protein